MGVTSGSRAMPLDGFTLHIFTSSGIFTPQFTGNVEILVVGAGGGGGMDMGGGGGGGEVYSSTTYAVTTGTPITVTIGAGGTGAPGGGESGQNTGHQFNIAATAGSSTVFGTVTATGGGKGGSSYFGYTPDNGYGGTGSSGGGASGYSDGNTGRGGAGTVGKGNNGGGSSGQYYAGGGGGAGAAGGLGTGSGAAVGGAGLLNSILGVDYYWGGGGGGATYSTLGGAGGIGGGGSSGTTSSNGGAGFNIGGPGGNGAIGNQSNRPGGNGGQNTGGGGGGGSHYARNNKGGNGGSGIVIVKYLSVLSSTSTGGNKIFRNEVVMYSDMGNTSNSWKGAPTTNIFPMDNYITWPSQTAHFWTGSYWVVDGTYTHPGVDGPQGIYLGKVRKYTSGALSATWSGNSYAYMLKSATMTNGQAYAMSTYAYVTQDCDISSMSSSIESVASSAMSNYNTGYDLTKKGTWQRFGLTCTAPATAINFIPIYPAKNGVTNGAFTGFFMYGGPMVETGTFPTPYTDGTRSNTESILDLSKKTTITAANLTYNSSGTFSFNGSSTYKSFSIPITPSQPYTLIQWAKPASALLTGATPPSGVNRRTLIVGPGPVWNPGIWVTNDNIRVHSNTDYRDVAISWTDTTYRMIGQTFDGTQSRVIYNGALYTGTSTAYSTGTPTSLLVGAETTTGSSVNWNGEIPVTMFFKRALTDGEVKQIFNANRGRFGV